MSVYLERFSPDKLKVKVTLEFVFPASMSFPYLFVVVRFVRYKLPFSIIKLVGNNNISPPCPPNFSTLTSDTVALAPTKLKGSEFAPFVPSADMISKLPVRLFIGSVCVIPPPPPLFLQATEPKINNNNVIENILFFES